MRRLVLSGALALVAGCGGGGDGGTEPDPDTGTLAGSVQSGAAGVGNVSISVTGQASRNGTTAGSGAYSFPNLPVGSYTVAITVPGNFELAAGEVGMKPATVTANQTTTVNFALEELNPATTIEANASSFSPADVTVPAGTRVRWTNDSGVAHTVTPSGHNEWTEAQLANQTTFEHTFDSAGTFDYLCTIHAGMTGVVRVQ